MNILIKHANFAKSSIQFLETKPNMLFDGLFTKINYGNDFMVMYGVFIDVPITVTGAKTTISSEVYETFKLAENDIMSEYIIYRGLVGVSLTHKLADYILSKYEIVESCAGESLAILKISGIWENVNGEVGLSFKLLKN
jgi:hypothetical protein